MPKAAHWERPAYPVGQEEANLALAPPHNVVTFLSLFFLFSYFLFFSITSKARASDIAHLL